MRPEVFYGLVIEVLKDPSGTQTNGQFIANWHEIHTSLRINCLTP
jgi:hypothetical protein